MNVSPSRLQMNWRAGASAWDALFPLDVLRTAGADTQSKADQVAHVRCAGLGMSRLTSICSNRSKTVPRLAKRVPADRGDSVAGNCRRRLTGHATLRAGGVHCRYARALAGEGIQERPPCRQVEIRDNASVQQLDWGPTCSVAIRAVTHAPLRTVRARCRAGPEHRSCIERSSRQSSSDERLPRGDRR